MYIVEKFLSLQGEGKFSGKLAFFIRFAGCNINCVGFNVSKEKNAEVLIGCDTLRAVYTEHFKNEYENVNVNTLVKMIKDITKDKEIIIVITGGEPTLWHKNKKFIELILELEQMKLEVHFESNASIYIDFDQYELYKNCIFAMSVKLSNSGVKQEQRINPKAIKAIIANSKDSFYKFVLDKEFIKSGQAEKEIKALLDIAKTQVYCMPMGQNNKELKINAKEVAKFCIENGYNYSDRLHIRLWGSKEGV